jgi:lysophospholipase L1-like esterase
MPRPLSGLICCALLFVAAAAPAAEPAFPVRAKRILFLGDSITFAGGYIAWIETQLRLAKVDPLPEFINLGLSSETVTGLSESVHPFPRPNVHERLDRALAKLRPDVVVACYGMNDGIYHPLGEERFTAYRAGIDKLIEKVHVAGAKLVLLTPPPFDPVPIRAKGKLQPAGAADYGYTAPYEDYDSVLEEYGRWILDQHGRVELVIDVHTPIETYVAEQRQRNPEFTHAPDSVHPNAEGQRVLGGAVLKAWGVQEVVPVDPELLKLVTQKQAMLRDAWLTEVGHTRPGGKPGLSVAEANAQAEALESRIAALLKD